MNNLIKLAVAGVAAAVLATATPALATDPIITNLTHGVTWVTGGATTNASTNAVTTSNFYQEVAVAGRYKLHAAGAGNSNSTFIITAGHSRSNMFNIGSFSLLANGTTAVSGGTNIYIGSFPFVGFGGFVNGQSNGVIATNIEVRFIFKPDRNGYGRPQ